MRFVVDKVEQQGYMTLVTGETSVGVIQGIWKYREPPIVGNNYHIELSIDCPCEIAVPKKTGRTSYVNLHCDKVIFNGICEDIDEDVYYLRFDIDWLEMLDIQYIASKKKMGDFISFSASIYGIGIYPYTI